MTQKLETPDGVQIVPSGQADINPDDIEQTLRGQLPLFENPRKADYLANRSCGFSVREAAALAQVKQHTISAWRRDDPEFAKWEGEKLIYLQTNLSAIVMRAKFARNMMLGMIIDGKVLSKAAYAGVDNLSPTQKEYLLKIARKMYDPQALLALERAAGEAPEEGDGATFNIDKAVVFVDGKEVETVVAGVAASAQLLKRFTANRDKYLPEGQEEDVVEGEVVDDGS